MENSPSLKTPQKQEDQNANLNSNQEEKETYDFYLLVYNISKHKNIGTLIRSASAFNIKKVFIIGENKKMEHIKNFAQINEELLSVALSESKSKYIEASIKNKSYVLHEWSKEDRINFVRRLVSSYLNNSKAQADD